MYLQGVDMKYNKWTIVEKLKGGKCIAVCDCGFRKEQWFNNIKTGKSKQCSKCQSESYKERGELHDIGGAKHPLYNVWSGIKRRCYNKNQKSYKNYGSKGVVMCEEWNNSYRSFYEWCMNNGYKNGMAITRIGDIGNYEPSNCEIKTFSENSKEIDRNHMKTIEYRKRISIEKSKLSKDDYIKCIGMCSTGLYRSNELVDKFGVDRHTILRMCRLYDIKPKWRKGIVKHADRIKIREMYKKEKSYDKVGKQFNVSGETIRQVVNMIKPYDNDGNV
jgi:hypothetical protein